MSYKVKQIQNFNGRKTFITIDPISVTVKSDVGQDFDEIGFSINTTLSTFENYYLSFSVERVDLNTYKMNNDDYSILTFKICLLEPDSGSNFKIQQVLNSYTVEPYVTEEDSRVVNFEFTFSPKQASTYLGFILSREVYDYAVGPRTLPLVIDPNPEQHIPGLSQLTNFFPNITALKIGVQSRPGLLMCINKESIRIGRSGVYEINNGYPINFFNIPSDDNFILDYAYDG